MIEVLPREDAKASLPEALRQPARTAKKIDCCKTASNCHGRFAWSASMEADHAPPVLRDKLDNGLTTKPSQVQLNQEERPNVAIPAPAKKS
jgi:hypothetical protein